ncbi:DUF3572 domain-containing protein [Azospirillaceae bacterium]
MDPFKPYQPKAAAKAPPRMTDDVAEAIALQAVAYLMADEDLTNGFLAASGCAPEELSNRLNDRGFLLGALDYLLSDDSVVTTFAGHIDVAPETPQLAKERLTTTRNAGAS